MYCLQAICLPYFACRKTDADDLSKNDAEVNFLFVFGKSVTTEFAENKPQFPEICNLY